MGVCIDNKRYKKNYQTTININSGPICNKIDSNNTYYNNYYNQDIISETYFNDEKFTIQKNNSLILNTNTYSNNNTNNNTNNGINELNKQFNDLKLKNKIFCDDIKEQEKSILYFKSQVSKLFTQKRYIKANCNQPLPENINYSSNELLISRDKISNKINLLNDLVGNQKNELKNLESIFKTIQEQFNDIKKNEQNYPSFQDFYPFININNIKQQLYQSKTIIKKLELNNNIYQLNKNEIEKELKEITKEKVTSEKILLINSNNSNKTNDFLFIKNSMLLGIKDLRKAKDLLNPLILFSQDENENVFYQEQNLILKNWQETCYINDDYDIYEVNYKLTVLGLPENMVFIYSFFFFEPGYSIQINLFEIDGIKTIFSKEDNHIKFNIKLHNLESNNIHIIYKESPLFEEMTEGEKKLRKIYRNKSYGLTKLLAGQKAKFTLLNKSNFEIINFEDEFFIQTKDNEYQWGGLVPENGKKTKIRMSKKECNVNFYEKHVIKTIDNSFITNTVTKIPFCYIDGNNQIIKINYTSRQTKKIRLEKYRRVFIVKYLDLKSSKAEFNIKGILKNKCEGEWKINLTNEDIESLIPQDVKINKEAFKKIANEIINNYNETHKNDLIIIPDVAKIGKWVQKNIIYDLTYKEYKDLTAAQVYILRRGVCHHLTKLFNALMYSLGYQVIYVLGYIADKKTTFSIEDAHAWSLIKIEGKWLPFDATWGIFSGKLPVTYIFKQISSKEITTMSCDNIKIEPILVQGEIS